MNTALRILFTALCFIPARADASPNIRLEANDGSRGPFVIAIEGLDPAAGCRAYVRTRDFGFVEPDCLRVGPVHLIAVPRAHVQQHTIELYVSSRTEPVRTLAGSALEPIKVAVPLDVDEDVVGPEITFVPREVVSTQVPFVIEAVIRDPSGILSAEVRWKEDGDKGWTSIPMRLQNENDYKAKIGPEYLTQGFVYYLAAYDKAGNETLAGSPAKPIKPALTAELPAWASPVTDARPAGISPWGIVALSMGTAALGGGGVAAFNWFNATDFAGRQNNGLLMTSLLVSGAILVAGGGVLLAMPPHTP